MSLQVDEGTGKMDAKSRTGLQWASEALEVGILKTVDKGLPGPRRTEWRVWQAWAPHSHTPSPILHVSESPCPLTTPRQVLALPSALLYF